MSPLATAYEQLFLASPITRPQSKLVRQSIPAPGLDPIVRPGAKQKGRRAVRTLPLPFWEMKSARAGANSYCQGRAREFVHAVHAISSMRGRFAIYRYISQRRGVGGGQGAVRAIVARNGQPRGGGVVGVDGHRARGR